MTTTIRWAALALLAACPTLVIAEEAPTLAEAPTEAQLAFEAGMQAMVRGPADVKIADQAVIHLPDGYGFVPQAQAKRMLEAMGNVSNPKELGLLLPLGADGFPWFTIVTYEPEGYIKDDDAKDWDKDELLDSFREGTEADNERRRKAGFTELEVVGWAEPPSYDPASHRLVWSIAAKDRGAPADAEQGVNFKTLALGREGYIGLNMVTGLAELDKHRADAHTLIGALEFNAGKRYGDFVAGTDRVAEYGLAALVAGVAAKKLGLLALAAAFMVKAWKLVAVGVFAASAGIKKFFGKKDGSGTPA
jgi:uncharacterized membrane-anchored protein